MHVLYMYLRSIEGMTLEIGLAIWRVELQRGVSDTKTRVLYKCTLSMVFFLTLTP